MIRFLAVASTTVLLLFVGASPAAAADCEPTPLGSLCLSVENGQAVVTGPLGIFLSVPAPVEVVQLPPVVIETPGPVVRVPVPTTETVTRTVTQTETVPGPASTSPELTSPPTNTSAGQTNFPSATLSDDTQEPSLAEPPPESEDQVDIIPHISGDTLTGGLLGLIVGTLLGILVLRSVYKRGKKEGEEETLSEFLGIVRDNRKAQD